MPSIAINIALLVALVFTCGFSFAMLREFRRFKAHAGEYGSALHEAARAMGRVDEALARTHDEGARTAITLGERLDAAQRTLEALKATEATASAQLLRLRERIHEAREAATIAEAAIRRDDETGGKPAGAGRGKAGTRKAPRKNSREDENTVEAEGPRIAKDPACERRNAAAPVADDAESASQKPRRLALAPAEKAAQDAPRTRRILSWPVIRNARIAAGS